MRYPPHTATEINGYAVGDAGAQLLDRLESRKNVRPGRKELFAIPPAAELCRVGENRLHRIELGKSIPVLRCGYAWGHLDLFLQAQRMPVALEFVLECIRHRLVAWCFEKQD